MSTVYATAAGDLDDGFASGSGDPGDTTYASTRDDTTALSVSQNGAYSFVTYARGAAFFGNRPYTYRSWFNFDLTGESGTATSANLKISSLTDLSGFVNCTVDTDEEIYICKLNAGSAFDTGDFDGIVGWQSSGTYDGSVTQYATAVTQAVSTQYTIALNATAITDINSLIGTETPNFQIALLTSNDFLFADFTQPSFGFQSHIGLRFHTMETSSADSYKPQIEITYGVAAVADSATFFGSNF